MIRCTLLSILGLLLFCQLTSAEDLVLVGPGFIGNDIRAIAPGTDGGLLVGSSGRLSVFNSDGSYFSNDDRGQGQQINSIAIDTKGNLVLGLNGGGVIWHQLRGEPIRIGGFGQYSPWEITFDPEGKLYATDGGNGVVKQFNDQGTLLKVYTIDPKVNASVPAMVRPFSVALDSTRRLWVSDERQKGIWIFNADGTFAQRLVPDEQCWRIRKAEAGMYVVTDVGTTIFDPKTLAVVKKIKTPAGYHAAMGFMVANDGSLYFGGQNDIVFRKYSPDGELLATLGPDFRATVSVPTAWKAGEKQTLAMKLEPLATKRLVTGEPKLALSLEPALLEGEPDSNWSNSERGKPDPKWLEDRQSRNASAALGMNVVQKEGSLDVTPGSNTPSNVYRLIVQLQDLGGATDPLRPRSEAVREEQIVRVVKSDAPSSGLTLFVPRSRSVFAQGETIEIAAILRTANDVPLDAGPLLIGLAPRAGDALSYLQSAPAWKQFDVTAGGSRTLTLRAATGGIHPGRYQLQAKFTSGGYVMRDVWPIEIVSRIEPTNFRILFPEWSAGYTHIWGPFTGRGMAADLKFLAQQGIGLYDETILERGYTPPLQPVGPDAARVAMVMNLAAGDPALPAPEHFIQASPLEIEYQEALRNGLEVQRDIWGSHFLNNWGMAQPLGVDRDNRIVKLWTQWQREWPSWIGHRYLTLSIDEGDNPERVALLEQLSMNGLTPPTEKELEWARNGPQRGFISDAHFPPEQSLLTIGGDSKGNVYMAAGTSLVRLNKAGKVTRTTQIPGTPIDLFVTTDGEVYVAHQDGQVSITTNEGKMTSWKAEMGPYSPRGIWLTQDKMLLLSDERKSRVRKYSVDGKLLGDIGDEKTLGQPAGICTLKDGTIVVADAAKGGLMLFTAKGAPIKFLPGIGGHTPGGKMDVYRAPDDTLWVTAGYGSILHVDREGKSLGQVGHNTFAPGGLSLPTSVSMSSDGNLLVADVTTPYAQEIKLTGEPVHVYGLNTLLADVRIDRQRYAWTDRIIATVWMPIPGQTGNKNSTLSAFARKGQAAWQSLKVQPFGAGDFAVEVPKEEGDLTLRLLWIDPQAAGKKIDPENPLHADYKIAVQEQVPDADAATMKDTLDRQIRWKEAWSRTRMGTLVRWMNLSDVIRPGTQNTAPTNYGTPDTLAEGVWVPYRRDAVVAEAENEGHDHGSYPLQGAWYVARALEGPNPKPAWCSLLSWYWKPGEQLQRPIQRPRRDFVLMLGAGATGIGTGQAVFDMDATQLSTHRNIADTLLRIGDAMIALDPPGQGGVGVLHSFTQESMDPYNNEQFYAAHAAWYDLLRAHVPAAVVSEESIASDDLAKRFKAILLPYIQFPLPEKTMAGLAKFQEAGGVIWIDLGSRIDVPGAKRLETRYRPFWIQDAYYWMHSGYGIGGYDGNYEYWRMKQGSNDRLHTIRLAFSDLIEAQPLQSDDADVYYQYRKGGDATYVFASNDHFPDEPLYKTHLASQTPEPFDSRAEQVGDGVVYDLLKMEKREVAKPFDSIGFTDFEPARIFVVLPRAIGKGKVSATLDEQGLLIRGSVYDEGGKPLAAVVPIRIHVDQSTSTLDETRNGMSSDICRSTDAQGEFEFRLPVGWQASQGKWDISVTQSLTNGVIGNARVAVGDRPQPELSSDSSAALTFDHDAIAKWLGALRGQELWIALDKDQEPLRAMADELAKNLRDRRGIQAKVINLADLPESPIKLEYKLEDADAQLLERIRNGEAVGVRQRSDAFRTPGPERMIMRPLLLLGDGSKNRWLKDIDTFRLAPRLLSPSYPGPGRALLQYVWAPFYDGFDALTIESVDDKGLSAGIEALLKIEPVAKGNP